MKEEDAKSVNDSGILPNADDRLVPCDERSYFDSFYASNVRGERPTDRDTIGVTVSEPESRYHYNTVENSIIASLSELEPLPAPPMIQAWTEWSKRGGKRLLDVGSGTGHWIDFFDETYFVSNAVAVEIAERMALHLERKYVANDGVRVLNADVASDAFTVDLIGGRVDYITAIGVMFHITDDARWERALKNLSGLLEDSGIMLIGGKFGDETENVQFNRIDQFSSWTEFRSAEGEAGVVRVNKRVRSYDMWAEAAGRCGLRIVDFVEPGRHPNIATPENNLLVLMKKPSP